MDNASNDQLNTSSVNAGTDSSENLGEGQGERIKARAKQMASDAQDKVGDQLREGFNTGRKRAAGTLDSVAQSLISSADDSEGVTGRYIGRAGQQVKRLSDYLENTDPQQLMAQTEGFARRQPLLFLGGAFAIGLIAARYLKSSQRAENASSQGGGRRVNQSDWERQGDWERPLPGFREDRRMNARNHGDTGMGNEANPLVDPTFSGGDSLQADSSATPPRADMSRPGNTSESDRH
ncbi:MAG: hypothetical protein ABIT38_16500 [Gemmatimonadaceae bacterium]